MIDMYVKYAKVLFKEYKGLVKYWLTFNEINTAVMMLDMFGNKNDSDEAYQHAYQKLHYQFLRVLVQLRQPMKSIQTM